MLFSFFLLLSSSISSNSVYFTSVLILSSSCQFSQWQTCGSCDEGGANTYALCLHYYFVCVCFIRVDTCLEMTVIWWLLGWTQWKQCSDGGLCVCVCLCVMRSVSVQYSNHSAALRSVLRKRRACQLSHPTKQTHYKAAQFTASPDKIKLKHQDSELHNSVICQIIYYITHHQCDQRGSSSVASSCVLTSDPENMISTVNLSPLSHFLSCLLLFFCVSASAHVFMGF